MTIKADFNKYHSSIAKELYAVKDRVRSLIGNAHWGTDGAHKEAVLRNVLRQMLPAAYSVLSGFICTEKAVSTQLDLIVVSDESPTLFREGDIVISTPDVAKAIIEVKTRITNRSDLMGHLEKLAAATRMARVHARDCGCWSGLFVFDESPCDPNEVLESIKGACRGDLLRAIDCLTIGGSWFYRRHGESDNDTQWSAYELEDLAPAYFVSNLAASLNGWQLPQETQRAWFPAAGGKDSHRKFDIWFAEGGVMAPPKIQ